MFVRAVKLLASSLAIAAILIVVAWWFVVPHVIDHEVRTQLDAAGFPRARFEVGTIALDRVELLDVSLAQGLELGDVEIGAGPWALWRGHRPDVVLRGARVVARASVPPDGRKPGRAPPFRRVVIEDATVDTLAVRGTIDLRAPTVVVDVVAHAPALRLGTTVVEDVALAIRGPSTALRACATGRVTGARFDACVVGDAHALRSADLRWRAQGGDGMWSAAGTGRLVRAGDSVALEDGVVEATLTGRLAGLTVERATLRAEVAGALGDRRLTARGELRADVIDHANLEVRGARLPFALALAGDTLRSDALALAAKRATIRAANTTLPVDAPVLVARGSTELGGVTLVAGAPGRFELTAKLRGIPVDRLAAAVSRDRVRATGVLDGEVEVALDGDDLSLVGGSLIARGPGRLRATVPGVLRTADDAGIAVHRRLAAALADFNYSRLALTIGDDPDLRLSLRGRGHRVPQQLAIDLNVRGLLSRYERTR